MKILVAEDDFDQQAMYKECLKELDNSIKIIFTINGKELMHQLEDLYKSAQLPNLIILDLNMPAVDGRNVLAFVRQSEKYSHIPVYVISSSNWPIDKYLVQMFQSTILKKVESKQECLQMFRGILDEYGCKS